jgi:hypothetical protein
MLRIEIWTYHIEKVISLKKENLLKTMIINHKTPMARICPLTDSADLLSVPTK